jgi:hypothetical protein
VRVTADPNHDEVEDRDAAFGVLDTCALCGTEILIDRVGAGLCGRPRMNLAWGCRRRSSV